MVTDLFVTCHIASIKRLQESIKSIVVHLLMLCHYSLRKFESFERHTPKTVSIEFTSIIQLAVKFESLPQHITNTDRSHISSLQR